MKGFLEMVEAAPKPEFWYGLPYGYLQLDLHPSPEGIQEVARQLNVLPDDARDRADQVFRIYSGVLTMLRRQAVMGCALGMHPNERGEPTLSVLTVSTVPTSGANPNAVLLQMLGDVGMGTGPDNGIAPVELPVGTGYVLETVRTTLASTAPPDDQEGSAEETVWQGTVTIPAPRASSIITVQLVTASVELADDYRGVLLGVARTVTFADPAAPAVVNNVPGPFSGSGSGTEEGNPFG